MLSSFPTKVKAVIVIALTLNASCAMRAQGPLSSETSPASGASDMSLLAAAVVSPTLSALVGDGHEATPEQALAATQGGIAPELMAANGTGSVALPNAVHVRLANLNSHEEFEVDIAKDGRVAASQLASLDAFFSCRRTGRQKPINPGVLRVIAAIAGEYPGHLIEVVSGYRAPPFGVKDSKHFDGRAIDLRVRGVKLTKVRDFVWQRFRDVGVGYYGPQNFIHVDHRPAEKDTAWSSAHENAIYEYNPRWAMKIRPPWQPPADLVADEDHPVDDHGHEHAFESQVAMSSDAMQSMATN